MWGQPSSAVRRAKRAILHLTRSPVILSEVAGPRSEPATQSKSLPRAKPRGSLAVQMPRLPGELSSSGPLFLRVKPMALFQSRIRISQLCERLVTTVIAGGASV
jgi:hypothetical protein